MSSKTQSHQLSNGLIVSGDPTTTDHPSNHRTPSFSLSTLSLTPPSRPPSQPNSGSGPQPAQLHPTGLITSGPLPSPTTPSHPPDPNTVKPVYGSEVTNMGKDPVRVGYMSRGIMWVFGVLLLMGLLLGVFLTVTVKKVVILVVVVSVSGSGLVWLGWNCLWRKRVVLGFVNRFSETELRGAVDGQFVKVTGVVTCGSIPLESSFQRVPRCVYVSTELYEYKGWGGTSANPKHRCFSWGRRYSERYVADFYVSDSQSGLRALVKSGYGAKVAPLVKPSTVVDITKEKRDLSPNFSQWLADRSLSSDDRIMRLKEGYVKEGSTVSVMGVVRRHENIVMIVPPAEPVSTGFQWLRCLLPMYIEGLILHSDDNQTSEEVIPV
ncbi:putative membrane protein At1g16860 [Silene latifolia]|uniref:putative membrane protein At1g16860 n=1 Tax=Silene latifolia TaxID=37657 RepID=UPI003D7782F5